MALSRFAFLTLLLAVAAPAHAQAGRKATTGPARVTPLTADQRIVHALNRLAFGPRPGDLDAVRRAGLDRWIDDQLNPEHIDDGDLEAKLARLPDLALSPAQLLGVYSDTNMAQKAARRARRDAPDRSTAAGGPEPATMRMRPDVLASVRALGALDCERLARDIDSRRQTQEVLVDFWSNHFNVDARKGPVRTLVVSHVRDAIRPRVLGEFRDLLGAVAKSPAMLFYLDNASSTRDFGRDRAGRPRAGLNENYARELLELHTLGVDGGYTQKDVQEIARCLTGWSIDRATGQFRFYAARHDDGSKTVLGRAIAAGGGIQDGETVLDILASHQSTAHHLAERLCARLVSDDPPARLVGRVAQVFMRTEGDLRAVVRAIVTSPEFFSPAAFRSKVKSPLEFAVSSVRALGGTMDIPDPDSAVGRIRLAAIGGSSLARGAGARAASRRGSPLAAAIAAMGQPVFGEEAPTGYPEDSREWLAAGGLVSRMNFATALAGGKVGDVRLPPMEAAAQAGEPVLRGLSRGIVGAELSAATADALRAATAQGDNPWHLAALLCGSPEFQRH